MTLCRVYPSAAGRSLGIRQHVTDRPAAVGFVKNLHIAAEPSRQPVARGTSAVHAGKATLAIGILKGRVEECHSIR